MPDVLPTTCSCLCGKPHTLAERLLIWGRAACGWDGGFVESTVPRQPVAFRVGPCTGFGRTSNEAINNCADGLLEEGWPDDRPEETHA